MDDEHPGYIGHYLQRKDISYRIIRGYQSDLIPTLDESIAGLVFMGGLVSVNDDIPWIKQEIDLIREALDNNIPVLGHCLGGQLITVALGYEVTTNPVEEVGWHYCHKQPSRYTKDWLGDIDDTFIMFQWHLETFALPAEAQLLFSSKHCRNQAYCYGDNVLAMQGHVEMTEPMLVEWMIRWRSFLMDQSPSAQNYPQMNENLKVNITALNKVAEKLYQRWTSTLSL
jgi:GMP synthase-like glutamine amidotransferase